MKYRKKPIVVEAMQIPEPGYENREQGARLEEWLASSGHRHRYSIRPDATVLIHTLGGSMEGRPGDWIIKDVRNEFYPCRPDVFEATYELVEDALNEKV